MVLLHPRQLATVGPILNATAKPDLDDHAARRARHLRQCERLAELGMALAESAHREALRDLQPPDCSRPIIPGLTDMPGDPVPTSGRDATFGHLFAVLSRSVRQAILLEARIAAGGFEHARIDMPFRTSRDRGEAPAPQAGSSEPRDPAHRLAPSLTHERLEDDLAPQASRSAAEILTNICAELHDVVAAEHPHDRLGTQPATQHPNIPAAQPHRVAPPHLPPRSPPLTALQRAALLALQHATPPPKPPG